MTGPVKVLTGDIGVDIRLNGRVFTIEVTLANDEQAAGLLADANKQIHMHRHINLFFVCGPTCKITTGRVQ